MTTDTKSDFPVGRIWLTNLNENILSVRCNIVFIVITCFVPDHMHFPPFLCEICNTILPSLMPTPIY